VVVDDFADDEGEEFFGEFGVEMGADGEAAQAGDLAGFAGGVGRREFQLRLEQADGFGAFEALGEHVDDRGIDIVDAFAQGEELGGGFFGHAAELANGVRFAKSYAGLGPLAPAGPGRSPGLSVVIIIVTISGI